MRLIQGNLDVSRRGSAGSICWLAFFLMLRHQERLKGATLMIGVERTVIRVAGGTKCACAGLRGIDQILEVVLWNVDRTSSDHMNTGVMRFVRPGSLKILETSTCRTTWCSLILVSIQSARMLSRSCGAKRTFLTAVGGRHQTGKNCSL